MVIVRIIAGAVALVLVIEIARALCSRYTNRRRPALPATDTAHPKGCACSADCWDRYVTGLVSEYPWDRAPRVIRRRSRKAGTTR